MSYLRLAPVPSNGFMRASLAMVAKAPAVAFSYFISLE